jgi:hypothetical protein
MQVLGVFISLVLEALMSSAKNLNLEPRKQYAWRNISNAFATI